MPFALEPRPCSAPAAAFTGLRLPLTVLCLLACALVRPAAAQSEIYDVADNPADEQPAWMQLGPPAESFARVVQRRKYALRHELDLSFGGLPIDPLYKALTATVGYAFHFNHYLGWELARFTLPFPYDTTLKRQLALSQLSDIGPKVVEALDGRDRIRGFVSSRLVVKPLYGKEAFLDRGLVHLEVFLAAGPAILGLENVFNRARHRFVLGVDIALDVRIWLSRHVSVRAELADVVLLAPKIGHALHASGGLGFTFGGEG